MIAVTQNVLKILHVYRVFLAALGLTWIGVAIGVFSVVNVVQIGVNTLHNLQDYYPAFLVGFLLYLIYASFYGVYRLSRQISEFSSSSTVVIKLQTETFLAVMINVGISTVLVDHLIEVYGLQIHAVMLIIMLTAASSFTRHPFLKRIVNFFRKRFVKEEYDYLGPS